MAPAAAQDTMAREGHEFPCSRSKEVCVMSIVSKPASGRPAETPGDGLVDEHGPIPTFPPRQVDEHGRLIPISEEERRARHSAAIRALKALDKLPDNDPPGTEQEMMRGIDSHRPPGAKLFEGLY